MQLLNKGLVAIVAGGWFVSPIVIADNDVVVDVVAVAGKSQEDVEGLLGSPTSCSDTKYGEKCLYGPGETEIVFINGLADWITVEGIDHVTFGSVALESLGLTEKKPDHESGFSMKWDSIEPFIEVSIFKGASNADYAYIKTQTE